ncbi:CDGSH iron-sulfur domain-containing protein [Sneathiella aquimaris]|uniref:CDGSH iron-sulfur domain-containing protein n=1 Tax=Sneathiella aquimaris TaxID=2599305 RepID=UPI00146A51FA|nr:CDGSH iron-sulfur domain-containing protein [Sneathiella aquimaris]
MSEPLVAGTAPAVVDVKKGKTYFWCACGRSSKQPFCDGSHSGTEFTPVQYEAKKDGFAYFCTCKKTSKQPLCDGTHKELRK